MSDGKHNENDETGGGHNTVNQAVNTALQPMARLVWGYDQIGESIENKVVEILENVHPDRIIEPPRNVVGPAVEAYKFAGDIEPLNDFFIRLIAKSLDSKTSAFALPSYVDIIRNLVPDEGLILQLFTTAQQFPLIDINLKMVKTGGHNTLHRNVCMIGMLARCRDLRLTPEHLDHLCQLGLFEIPPDQAMTTPNAYEELTSHPSIEQIRQQFANNDNFDLEIDKKLVRLTRLGSEFIKTCVLNKKAKGNIA